MKCTGNKQNKRKIPLNKSDVPPTKSDVPLLFMKMNDTGTVHKRYMNRTSSQDQPIGDRITT